MKRIAFLLLGLAISVVSLYMALQGFSLDDLWSAIGKTQVVFLLLLIVPYTLTFMSKVWRWRVLFHPNEKSIRTGTLFSGLMISYVPLPFRAGEIARGVVVSAKSGIPAARVFSTILVEKVLDVLTLLLFLGVSLPFVALSSGSQSSVALLGGGLLLVVLALLALVLRPDLARKIVHVVAQRLPARFGPRIEEATDHALQGLAPLSNPRIAAKLGLWSLATWGVNSVTVYLMLLAFNITQLSPMAAVLLVVGSNLSMVIPAAPGNVGTFEAAVVAILEVLDVPRPDAQTFALVYHFVGLVPVAVMGVIAMVQQGVGWAVLRSDQIEDIGASETAEAVKPAEAIEHNGAASGGSRMPPAKQATTEQVVTRDKR